ncbi:FliM/FliN family flagellar motor switch protein [Roseibacterium sp. SDUM158016]|uniref:FliM/FliN family flagellar motor switch protein n=1 Tax=Roseicyclus sediminis TaxID=2980997 RepID=UPI0021CE841C|nr:FliM/FliN family flagellar motor switch protein [Roseibacterium sp. SDUM158016]MCU4654322.1 FliM/FliN family flagellar motor switch protein [Roseibacterium sp. SDUM158016]
MAENTKTASAGKKTADPVAATAEEGAEARPETSAGPLFEEIVPEPDDRQEPVGQRANRGIEAMLNVQMDVQVVLGHARMPIAEVLKLGRGSVVDLDRRIGDMVDIVVNDMLVARGNLVQTEGDRIGVTLTEIMRIPAND